MANVILEQSAAVIAVAWNSKRSFFISGANQIVERHKSQMLKEIAGSEFNTVQDLITHRIINPLNHKLAALISPDENNETKLCETQINTMDNEIDYFPQLKIVNTISAQPPKLLANTKNPIPIETENFIGNAMILLDDERSDSPDRRHIRAFEVQVQGKFKTKPQGTMFIGAEVQRPVKFNPIARLIARTVAAIVHDLAPGLHISLGSKPHVFDNSPEKAEFPHMTYPLWKAADTMHITKPNEIPPALGRKMPDETPEHYEARQSAKGLGEDEFNADDTFTFAFHSLYIDFVQWKVSKLKHVNEFGLELVWGTEPIQICMYEVPTENALKVHENGTKDYSLSFKMTNELATNRN